MIRHQAVGVTDLTVAFDDLAQNLQESNAIGIIKKDVLPRIPATRHVVQSTFVFNPQRPCHEVSLP